MLVEGLEPHTSRRQDRNLVRLPFRHTRTYCFTSLTCTAQASGNIQSWGCPAMADTRSGPSRSTSSGRAFTPSKAAAAAGLPSKRRSRLETEAAGLMVPASYLVKALGPPPNSSPASAWDRPSASRISHINGGTETQEPYIAATIFGGNQGSVILGEAKDLAATVCDSSFCSE